MANTSIPHQWKYDVFVSFRGEDIRKNFMDHMFNDFKQKGIHAFRDDRELPKGEEISPQLYKAIEESRFLIVIFSKNYASSTWCLRELVKILECKQIENPKHEVRIIFYDAKPDVAPAEKGISGLVIDSYGKSFYYCVDVWLMLRYFTCDESHNTGCKKKCQLQEQQMQHRIPHKLHVHVSFRSYFPAVVSSDASHMTHPIRQAATTSRTMPTRAVGTTDAGTQPTPNVCISSVQEVILSRPYVQHSVALIQQEHPDIADEEMPGEEQKKDNQEDQNMAAWLATKMFHSLKGRPIQVWDLKTKHE
ncbi:NB-ARC domains-containing protein [Artemisia annua]|uniref:ADP-ribosyl cyclase/cyclic ADP-ribose hydrolase n=1 Tax=Artemisia annua TaxID=35608 RepID=A0A2U1N0F3_ARTAN|nr:NB-ARC domains-containing protein [Artemisia annua]